MSNPNIISLHQSNSHNIVNPPNIDLLRRAPMSGTSASVEWIEDTCNQN